MEFTLHIKRRGTRAMLYRSSWVPKGSTGNTHGYSTQTFVGSLGIDAERLPAELENQLSDEELEYLESKLFLPARIASEQQKRAAEHRETDPVWRLEEAARLSVEAAIRSERGAVPNVKVVAIQTALGKVKTITPLQVTQSVPNSIPASAEHGRSDPLRDALLAIKAARDAVMAGRYGSAPAEGVRATYAYKKWSEIFEAVEGAGSDSLLRALQAKGFAKTRGK
jgi:hypothetical protein